MIPGIPRDSDSHVILTNRLISSCKTKRDSGASIRQRSSQDFSLSIGNSIEKHLPKR